MFDSSTGVTGYSDVKALRKEDTIVRINGSDAVGIMWQSSVLVKDENGFRAAIKDELSPTAIKLMLSLPHQFTLKGLYAEDDVRRLVNVLWGFDICLDRSSPIGEAVSRQAKDQHHGVSTFDQYFDSILFHGDNGRRVDIEEYSSFFPRIRFSISTEAFWDSVVKLQCGQKMGQWVNPPAESTAFFPAISSAERQNSFPYVGYIFLELASNVGAHVVYVKSRDVPSGLYNVYLPNSEVFPKVAQLALECIRHFEKFEHSNQPSTEELLAAVEPVFRVLVAEHDRASFLLHAVAFTAKTGSLLVFSKTDMDAIIKNEALATDLRDFIAQPDSPIGIERHPHLFPVVTLWDKQGKDSMPDENMLQADTWEFSDQATTAFEGLRYITGSGGFGILLYRSTSMGDNHGIEFSLIGTWPDELDDAIRSLLTRAIKELREFTNRPQVNQPKLVIRLGPDSSLKLTDVLSALVLEDSGDILIERESMNRIRGTEGRDLPYNKQLLGMGRRTNVNIEVEEPQEPQPNTKIKVEEPQEPQPNTKIKVEEPQPNAKIQPLVSNAR
eukprot:GHVS01075595.1.p1 GENE.GHVS01075595.1~~GHVS01075595.1.p1  ORF type:complete len:612 (-),score=36.04 GHVS01075595.1:168-1832(-)